MNSHLRSTSQPLLINVYSKCHVETHRSESEDPLLHRTENEGVGGEMTDATAQPKRPRRNAITMLTIPTQQLQS